MLYSFTITASEFAPVDTIVLKKSIQSNLKEKIYNAPLVLKTSPTAFLWGGVFPFTSEYRFMAEITTSRKQSEQVAFSILGKNVFLKIIEKAAKQPTDYVFKVSGWRVQYAHKFYLVNKRHHAPYGFYVAPLFSYTNAHIAIGLNRYYRKSYYDFRHFNANVIAGVQAGRIDKLTIDIYGGFGYKSNKVFYHFMNNTMIPYDTKDFGNLYNTHFNMIFGINLGYSF